VRLANQRNRELGDAFSHKGPQENTGLSAKAHTDPLHYPCVTKGRGDRLGVTFFLTQFMLNLQKMTDPLRHPAVMVNAPLVKMILYHRGCHCSSQRGIPSLAMLTPAGMSI
jgi:hypothetical protein